MSDPKRILLTTIGDCKKSQINVLSSASKTIRLDLNLFEPNADSFPEFNYSKLLHVEKQKRKKKVSKVNGFSDPFEDNNDDVTRIAKQFERKYGNAYTGRKAVDYCDKGAGYDETDEFIDNTEAYDEIIPDEIETDRGGFYINSGALEFKQMPNFERPEDAQRMPKPKKRQLSTTSESSASEDETTTSKKATIKNGHVDKKSKSIIPETKSSSSVTVAGVTVAGGGINSAAINNNNTINNNNGKDSKKIVDKTKLKEKLQKDDGAGSDSGKETKKPVKTTTVKDMLRAKRDSMRNMIDSGGVKSTTEHSDDSENESSSSDSDSDSSDEDQTASGAGAGNVNGQQRQSDVRLPDNIPTDLMACIYRITEAAKTGGTSKHNFFDANTMDLLYEIDTMASQKSSTLRNQIYNYLETKLPCTKQTILMRAKKVRIQKEENKTGVILRRLKIAVEAVMPQELTRHEEDCKRIIERREALAIIDGTENSEQLLKMPRKRFPWTETTKEFLVDLITTRRESYEIIQPRKETLEEFVNRYLRDHALKLWPDGWMKLEELHKEFDKSKRSSKNPKENKKPADLLLPATSLSKLPPLSNAVSQKPIITTNNNVLTSSVGKPATISTQPAIAKESKSILSTNNATTMPTKVTSNISTKDSTVKSSSSSSSLSLTKVDCVAAVKSLPAVADTCPTAFNEHQLINVTSPTPSFGNSLTITPIGASDLTSKPLPSVQNKVTITNIDSNKSSQSNLTAIKSTVAPPCKSKTSVTTTTTTKESVDVPTSGGGGGTTIISKNNELTITTSTVTITTSTTSTTTSSSSSTTVNLTSTAAIDSSPPKRSTDHSINRLIASQSINNHSTNSMKSPSAGSDSSTTESITHVINLDNLKHDDILNTAAAAQTNPSSKSSTIDNAASRNIRVRSVDNVNNIDKVTSKSATTKTATTSTNNKTKAMPLPKIIDPFIEEISSSSSSDDVEFIGVSTASNTQPQQQHQSRNKRPKPGPKSKTQHSSSSGGGGGGHKKSKKDHSRSNSPALSKLPTIKMISVDDIKRKVEPTDANDFDVNQVMQDLKVLHELTGSSNMHNSSSSESNSSSSPNHRGNLQKTSSQHPIQQQNKSSS